jgi:phosphoenolpyruvate-protein kinase (PTS system EI component)
MDGLGAGKLCVLSHKDIGLIVQDPQADDHALARKFHGAGVIAVGGAPLSHVMIRLFSLVVPTVIVSSEQLMGLSDGTALILDGATGLICDPSQATPAATQSEPVIPQPGASVTTAGGVQLRLMASISGTLGAASAVTCGAASIGLIRSEYLLPPDDRLPDADYFEAVFERLCEAARPLPLTLRLVDIAAGKSFNSQTAMSGAERTLGARGSQLYSTESVHRVFQAQVEAVGRLAARFDLSLLLPNVWGLDAYRHWRSEIERLLNGAVRIGAMAETPAAALAIADLLKRADFVAIGCNDLMQCFFGIDRNIAELSRFLDPCAPTLLRFLREVAEVAGERLAEVQLCGLLPQFPGVLPVLVGIGFRSFSVEPCMIPCLAETIRGIDTVSASALAASVCSAPDSETVRGLLGLPQGSAWVMGTDLPGHGQQFA